MTAPEWKIDTTFAYQTLVEHGQPTPMKPFLAAALGQTATVVTTEDACPQYQPTAEKRREATERLEKMLADDYLARRKASGEAAARELVRLEQSIQDGINARIADAAKVASTRRWPVVRLVCLIASPLALLGWRRARAMEGDTR